jgi:putative (di)nucleoside polyphosphate hydrolase
LLTLPTLRELLQTHWAPTGAQCRFSASSDQPSLGASMPIDKSQLPYRLCVGVMLFNAENDVWVGRRVNSPNQGHLSNFWQMPQGGIDDGEDPAAAALRELFEETSVRSATILAESREWYPYDLPKELIGNLWGGKYRGQTQRWFAVRFDGDDAEINIAPPGHEREFIEWRWAPMAELPRLIVPFKRDVYTKVIAEFQHLIDA